LVKTILGLTSPREAEVHLLTFLNGDKVEDEVELLLTV
jgi:hypothetical protein